MAGIPWGTCSRILFAGNSIDLSKKISSALEQSILTYPYDIHDLEDDKEKLEEMQLNIYPLPGPGARRTGGYRDRVHRQEGRLLPAEPGGLSLDLTRCSAGLSA